MTFYTYTIDKDNIFITKRDVSNPKTKEDEFSLYVRLIKKYGNMSDTYSEAEEKAKQLIPKEVVKEDNKPRKGYELCNRTACQTDLHVNWKHNTNGLMYCHHCAELINDWCYGSEFYPLLKEIK